MEDILLPLSDFHDKPFFTPAFLSPRLPFLRLADDRAFQLRYRSPINALPAGGVSSARGSPGCDWTRRTWPVTSRPASASFLFSGSVPWNAGKKRVAEPATVSQLFGYDDLDLRLLIVCSCQVVLFWMRLDCFSRDRDMGLLRRVVSYGITLHIPSQGIQSTAQKRNAK